MSLKLKKKTSILEQLGIEYFEKLENKSSAQKDTLLEDIPSDKVLEAISNVIVKNATIIAFLIGAIVTVPLVLFEVAYYDKLSLYQFYLQYSIYGFISLVIELILLYLLTLHSIYALLHLIGKYPQVEDDLPEVYRVDRILIRSALELEEPILEFMGLDPKKKLSKSKMFFAALLYKLKVILSSFLAKKLLKAIIPRAGARSIIVPFVGVLIVAFWDAFVISRSIKDAKLRLFGYYFSKYLIEKVLLKKISDNRFLIDIEGAIRAIASIMVLSKSNHPNNLLLLVRLSKYINQDITQIDSIDAYKEYLNKLNKKEQHYLKVLSTIAAILDGVVTKEEKEGLQEIYGKDSKYYFDLLKKMQTLLKKGHIHELTQMVIDEFN